MREKVTFLLNLGKKKLFPSIAKFHENDASNYTEYTRKNVYFRYKIVVSIEKDAHFNKNTSNINLEYGHPKLHLP